MDDLILASKSRRRRDILESLNIPYILWGINIDESLKSIKYVKSSVIDVSRRKAFCAKKHFSNGLVIGVDTVVYFNNRVLNKPDNREEAYSYMKMLNGNRHEVFSGITLVNSNNDISYSSFSVTQVYFNKISDKEIKRYIDQSEWRGKAGGYAIQGIAALFIEKIVGSYYNVMGLPIEKLYLLLKKFDYFEKNGKYRPVKNLN